MRFLAFLLLSFVGIHLAQGAGLDLEAGGSNLAQSLNTLQRNEGDQASARVSIHSLIDSITSLFRGNVHALSNNDSTNTDTCTCGVRSHAGRVVGGRNAQQNEFPWRCGLVMEGHGMICGASIISKSWLMTAAHCCQGIVNERLSASVNCGDHDLSTNRESPSKITKVSRILVHPKYNKKTQDNDICLLQVAEPLEWNRATSPICLPWQGQGNKCRDPHTPVVATGWGTDKSGGRPHKLLQKVNLPCMSSQACKPFYKKLITKNMMCTYREHHDTCQGDSGGSIDFEAQDNGRYYAIGVVSWGVGCAAENKPGVYAIVQNYLRWITSVALGEGFCGK